MKRCILLLSIIIILAGCNGAFGGNPLIPSNPEATKGTEEERIIITWDSVKDAGIYYIYKSETEAEIAKTDDLYAGSTAACSYIDTDITLETHYFYAVTAANIYGQNESGISTASEGWSHVFIWEDSVTVSESAKLPGSAVSSDGTVYYTYIDTTDNSIVFKKYEDSEWTDLSSPGTSAADNLSLSVSGNTPYIGYMQGSDTLTVKQYEEDEWTLTGDASFASGVDNSLSIAADNSSIYAAFINNTNYYPEVWEFNLNSGTVWISLGESENSNTFKNTVITILNGTPYIAYEDTDTKLVVKAFNQSWAQTGGDAASGDITDNNIALFVNPENQELCIAYHQPSSVYVKTLHSGVWEDITDGGLSAGAAVNSISLTGSVSGLYLFYKKNLLAGGAVMKYEDSVWTEIGSGLTDSGAEDYSIMSSGKYLYLSYLEGTKAMFRVFK